MAIKALDCQFYFSIIDDMQNIEERRKQILETVVQEYIDHCSPISSDFLKNECALDVSPATIRMDLVQLTHDGFLQKTHISSGRVPTDKGYRFFVDSFFDADIDMVMNTMLKEFNSIFGEMNDMSRLSHKLATDLAATSNNLSIVSFGGNDILCKEGWDKVIKAPEFNDAKYLKSFVDFVSDFERKFKDIDFKEGERVKIFIGKEAPSSEKEFSAVVGQPQGKNKKEKPKFAILGPKRMNFKKNVALINSLIETVENFYY